MENSVEFVLDLTRFVTEHIAGEGDDATPAQLGIACGDWVRRWLGERRHHEFNSSLNEAELVAWAERYGKHLGVFFSNERSH